MPRGIEKVILLPQGLVMCKDGAGRQSPSLQGLYNDVIENISKTFKPDEVKWIVFLDNKENVLNFDQWCAVGRSIMKSGALIENKPLDGRKSGI